VFHDVVHERDAAVAIRGDHRITDARESDVEQLALIASVLFGALAS
jgi:hypothetical protein